MPNCQENQDVTTIRYGIFLRPDPATCWAVTQITYALQQQYGLVAAAAFPPHATLIGNLQSKVPESELVSILDTVFNNAAPFPVYNHGVARTSGGSFRYDLNLDQLGVRANAQLGRMAAAVRKAVLPLHARHDDYLAPNVQEYAFEGHLTLAGFELHIDSRLSDEVGDFLAGLPVSVPDSFAARWYTLFQFDADWDGHWWTNMPWWHVKSWDTATESPLPSLPPIAKVQAK